MFKKSWLATLLLTTLVTDVTRSYAAPGQSFSARVKLQLCEPYVKGGAQVAIKYRVEGQNTVQDAQIVSYSLNKSRTTGVFQVYLPAKYGRTPIHVFAKCITGEGVSEPSNSKSITNCDALSIIDSDKDGITDDKEDTDCSNSYTAGDASNVVSVDTDGDGMLDLNEVISGTDPQNPGSSPRPYVMNGGVFDPDNDGNANPVVWRPSTAHWYVRDFVTPGNHLAFPFGLPGDTPATYDPAKAPTDVAVIRNIGGWLHWFFRGRGFKVADGTRRNVVLFGKFGDQIVIGPWEFPETSNPAIVRFENNEWHFYAYASDGTFKHAVWGKAGDIPKVQDYDGDGLFDVAVYRPTSQAHYVIHSSDGSSRVYNFGPIGRDHFFRGDVTGDGLDDISVWEPTTGIFETMLSDQGFNGELTKQGHPDHYAAVQLGLYAVHTPLRWNTQGGLVLYTVVDHETGYRYFREDNRPEKLPAAIQWGLAGDAHG